MSWAVGYTGASGGMSVIGSNLYVTVYTDAGGIAKADLATGTIIDSNWATGLGYIGYTIVYSNTIYVTWPSSNSIYSVDSNGTATPFFNSNLLGSNINMINPTGLAIDGEYLYAISPPSSNIIQISVTNPLSNYDDAWIADPSLVSATQVCIHNGFMYIVADPNVISINMSTKELSILTSNYSAVAIATDGNALYVAGGDNTLRKFSFTGYLISSNIGNLQNAIAGLLVNDSYIYAIDNNDGDIRRFSLPDWTTAWSTGYAFVNGGMAVIGTNFYTTEGTTVRVTDLATGSNSSNLATGFNQLGYIVATSNMLYVSDTGTGLGSNQGEIDSIYAIDLSGNVTPFFNSNLVGSNINMTNPLGLAIDGGYLYVANNDHNIIIKISLTNPTTDYNKDWVDDTIINSPIGICIVNTFMYVSAIDSAMGDYILAKINMSTAEPTIIATFPSALASALGISSDGNALYVGVNSNIQKFSFDGDIINDTWASLPLSNASVIVNGSYVYATNSVDGFIYRYSLNDWNTAWSTGYGFHWGAMAAIGSNFYTAAGSNIIVTDLATGSNSSNFATGFNQLGYIVATSNMLYVADTGTGAGSNRGEINSIYEIDLSGNVTPFFNSNIFGNTINMSNPIGLAIDGNYLYVAASGGSNIIRLMLNNANSYNQWLSDPSISNPHALSINYGYMYVSCVNSNGSNSITRINMTTKAITVLGSFAQPVYGLANYGNYLYAGVNSNIKRLTLKGSGNDFFAVPNVDGLMVNGGFIYGANIVDGFIYKTALPTEVAWSSGYDFHFQGNVVIDGSNLYAATTTTITRADISGNIIDPSFATGFAFAKYIILHSNIFYVSDITGKIYTVDLNGTVTEFFSSVVVGSNITMNGPRGLAIDSGYLYVATSAGTNILKISLTNPTTDYNDAWIVNTIGNPQAMCIVNGFMYVGYGMPGNVSYGFVGKISLTTAVETQLASPNGIVWGIAIDGNILYVSNPVSGSIETYSLTGTILNSNWASVPNASGLTISGRYIYGVDGSSRNIYRFSIPVGWSEGYQFGNGGMAVNGTNLYATAANSITVTPLDTGIISSNIATGFNQLGYIVANSGTLYVTDSGTGTGTGRGEIDSIYTIDSSGTVTPFFNSNVVGSNINMGSPCGLAIDGGYVYVAASGGSNIVKISLTSPTTDYNDVWVSDGIINGPIGISIVNGFMYVTTFGSAGGPALVKIDMATQTFTLLHTFADIVAGISTDGNALYVSVSSNIQKISFSGTVINSNWAVANSNSALANVLVNAAYVYASDYENGAIFRYALNDWNTAWSTGYAFVHGGMVAIGSNFYTTEGTTVRVTDLATGSNSSNFATGFNQLGYIVATSNMLYVADTGTGAQGEIESIYTIDLSGTVTPFFNSNVVSASINMSKPIGLVLDGDFLYVAASGSSIIFKINLTSPTAFDTWVLDPSISNPHGLSIQNGYMYVSCVNSNGSNSIARINMTTQAIIVLASFDEPAYGLSIYQNYLYAGVNSNIKKLTLKGSGNDFSAVPNVDGLMVNSGFIYGANNVDGFIYKTALSNQVTWSSGYDSTDNSFGNVAIDGSNVYAVTTTTITRADISGNIIDPYFATGFNVISRIILHSNTLYVSDYNANKIYTVDLSGTVTEFFSSNIASNMIAPYGLAINSGYLYVSCYDRNNIIKISLTDASNYNDSWLVSTIGNQNAIYIANGFMYALYHTAIGKINLTTAVETQIGTTGTGFGIAIDGNNVYVADYSGGYIKQYSVDGTLVNATWATVPQVDGLTISGRNIYAGTFGPVIYRFSLDIIWSAGYTFTWSGMAVNGSHLYATTSTTVTQTDLATGSIVNSNWATGFNELGYIVANSNTLYVADTGTGLGTAQGEISSIYTINSSGTVTPFFNSNLVASNVNLSNPVGLAIDGDYLYVASSGSSNILKISLTNPTTDYDDAWVSDSRIHNPVGICIVNGSMYVSSTASTSVLGTNVLSKINMTTQSLTVLRGFSNAAYGIANYGNSLYVAVNSNIQKISFTGTVINSNWASVPNANGVLVNAGYLYGADVNDGDIYRFALPYEPVICFKDGTLILTDKGYFPVEELRTGHMIKTLLHGYKPIYMIGKKEIYHPATEERGKDQLYIATQAEFPWLKQDLIITGSHCILVDRFEEGQREKMIEVLGKPYVTDRKYRLPACADNRFAVYRPSGMYTVYHLALEHENYRMNYGIFANGLLVETCSKRCIEEYGKMEVIV